MKKPLVILTGPTAVGKTALSINLAKKINGEIISADSIQVYKGMDIGSAKIKQEEMEGIKHYLIDVLEPTSDFNVVIFKEMALKAMDEIYSKGKIPIVTGGTGFYIQALLNDIDFTKTDTDNDYRMSLEKLDKEVLYKKLQEVDSEAAKAIHPNNVKRVIRALEFYKQSGGKKISKHNEEERKKSSPYNFAYLVLTKNREELYKRIEKRIDLMMEDGLIDEVKRLKEAGCTKDMVSMQGLGYKEILAYLEGEYSLEEAIYTLKRDTRHFAKRQMTWFRREKEVHFIDKDEFRREEELLNEALRILELKGIINHGI
ncbi:tRNA delta(2)-isopentenylpyrophosphate transferase [Lachnospiraceae bacterium TWA4]|nr:tRNA delta(2)-isopentenylpyrophosphate transferase [Lachnospiraceae bacterium TWA4]